MFMVIYVFMSLQLDGAQGEKLAKIFHEAKGKNLFFAAADKAINHNWISIWQLLLIVFSISFVYKMM